MNDTERVIGMLMEFKRSHEKRMDAFEKTTTTQFKTVNQKLDKLNQFKWKVAGGAGALSAAITLFIKFWK